MFELPRADRTTLVESVDSSAHGMHHEDYDAGVAALRYRREPPFAVPVTTRAELKRLEALLQLIDI